MILNEYKYTTRFETEGEARDYYKTEYDAEITKGHNEGSSYVVDDYKKLSDEDSIGYKGPNKVTYYNDSDNKFDINKEFKKFLKKNKLQIGEHNIIRTGKDYDKVLKKLKEFEKKYNVKIPISNDSLTQGGETFVQLKSDKIE